MKKAILKLKDGKEFEGIAFGAPIYLECSEVVFNTGTPGYEEILTDPSYKGQIVVLTSPMIGNYGITVKDGESSGVKSTALIIKKLYRGTVMPGRLTLDEYLKKEGIPALEGVDTRALTIHLRENGSQNGILFYEEERKEAEEKLDSYPEITEIDLIDQVTVKENTYNPELGEGRTLPPSNPDKHFALVDYGLKKSIIENFYKRNIAVTLMKATTRADEVLEINPDCLFLSNGPGDPALLKDAVALAKGCIGKIPVEGICLGHQIITLALGGKTVKMKFGHHGSNQPVKDMDTGKTFVTAQNHGFMSDEESLPEGVRVWMRNANDNTVEGLYDEKKRVYSVQFHPEAAPGPEDALWIFDYFKEKAN